MLLEALQEAVKEAMSTKGTQASIHRYQSDSNKAAIDCSTYSRLSENSDQKSEKLKDTLYQHLVSFQLVMVEEATNCIWLLTVYWLVSC